jgi:hypothetical protein
MTTFVRATHPPNGTLGAVKMLLGAKATTKGIRAALRKTIEPNLQVATYEGSNDAAQDTLLFYFSGHGKKDEKGLTLYTWDSTMHASELLAMLADNPCRSAVVLDCCHAGAISPGPAQTG